MKTASLPNLNRESTSFPSFYTLYPDPDTTLSQRPQGEENEASETSPFNDSILPLNEIGLLAAPSPVEMFGSESGNFTQLRLDQTLPSTSSVGSNQSSGNVGARSEGPEFTQLRLGQSRQTLPSTSSVGSTSNQLSESIREQQRRPDDGQITEIVYKGNHNHPSLNLLGDHLQQQFRTAILQMVKSQISLMPHMGLEQMDSATPENSSVSIGDNDFDGSPRKSKSGGGGGGGDEFDDEEPDAKRWKIEEGGRKLRVYQQLGVGQGENQEL